MVNTHFDAWTAGTDTSERQAQAAATLLARLDQEGSTWCLGGDFNILPPGPQYSRLPPAEQAELGESNALAPLFERYQSVPSPAEAGGEEAARWLTHWRNTTPQPDRTIDFLFFPRQVRIGEHSVRQRDAGQTGFLRISDHFPVLAEITLPTGK
jgi:endonuclease/exonuclease/phosphatase family metal-dependent hydrolase